MPGRSFEGEGHIIPLKKKVTVTHHWVGLDDRVFLTESLG